MRDVPLVDIAARWNELHTVPRFSPQYPSELVIRWTFRNFPRDKASQFSLLDLGAGGGRHTAFWAREAYVATATDVSPIAVSQVMQWAGREKLAMAAEVAEADALPFRDESFDGVLSFGVLYYMPYKRMRQAIGEIWRVLKPGGKAFVVVKSDADSRCRSGSRIDHRSYRVEAAESGGMWASEVGMALTMLNKHTLHECFAQFPEIVIDRSTVTTCNGRFVDDEWLVQLRK